MTENIQFRSDVTARLIDWIATDEAVVASARVSTLGVRSEEYLATPAEESSGLINLLMKKRHGTPFEHNCMTFFIEAPIFVFREFHRHRIGWSYNEESGRYKQLNPVFYLPAYDRPLVQTGKPSEYSFVQGTPEQHEQLVRSHRYAYGIAYRAYEECLIDGVAKEVARMCLPVGIYTSMYATCNARSLMNFLQLRTNDVRATFPSTPMHEIELVARQMEEQWAELMPITYKAFCENGRVAP